MQKKKTDFVLEAPYPECKKGELKTALCKGLDQLEMRPSSKQVSQLCRYLEELHRWNHVYNLTAIKELREMLVQHLFDCLAIIPPIEVMVKQQGLESSALRVLDVGSGAGLPSVVLAIMKPDWSVEAVDAVQKKMAFLQQQVMKLEVKNLQATHQRVEKMKREPFDLIISRAFSSFGQFVDLTESHLSDGGVRCAMKGKVPEDEIESIKKAQQIDVFHVEQLTVPSMDAERCLIWMRKCHS